MTMDHDAHARLGEALLRQQRRERDLKAAILAGLPQAVLNVPKGTLLAHLRCAGCGAYLAAVEDQAGLRCYRIGLEVWPLLPPPIACSDHGVMDVDDLNEFLALVSPADDNLPHNIKCPPWVPGSGS